jgi:hypothetical protein
MFTKVAFAKVFPDTVIGVTPQVLPAVELKVIEGQSCPYNTPEINSNPANKRVVRAIMLIIDYKLKQYCEIKVLQ